MTPHTNRRSTASARIDERSTLRLTTPTQIAQALPAWNVSRYGPDSDELVLRRWQGRRLEYSHVTGGGLSFERSTANKAGDDRLLISIVHAGRATTARAGQVLVQRPESVQALRLDAAYECVVDPQTVATLVTVPISWLESRGVPTKRVDGVVWSLTPMGRALLSVAEQMFATDMRGSPFEAAMLELVIGMLTTHLRPDTDDAQTKARERVLALIEEQYADAALDPGTISRQLNLSRRYLYSLFESSDVSVASLIRQRRVVHAQLLLVSRPTMPLRQVAQLSGLSSEDRLLRTFRAVIGVSPSQFRRDTQRGAIQGTQET